VREREKIIGTISDSAKKTYNLLENLLLWSRTETGRLMPQPTRLNLRELMEETLTLLSLNIQQKKISVENNIEEKAIAYADRNMISTVFRNIVSNAIKYVHANGNITLSTEVDLNHNAVDIKISDDGVGIDPEVLKTLFDLDSNYSTKGTNNESGTGLGLKLCNEFVLKNGGRIQVASKLAVGSEFKVTLPLAT
jgi:signal transduction histidine kinase